MNKELIPHKHAEVIKAWADGETIEVKANTHAREWVVTGNPIFSLEYEYRVKPKETVRFLEVRHASASEPNPISDNFDNLKLTFDDEGNLLTAEVIKNET